MPAAKAPKGTRKRSAKEAASPAPKPVRASQVEMLELVLPQDTNPLGNVLGGQVMHLMDQAAAAAAVRHARRPVVTASVDKLDFRAPIRMGEFIILQASVNAAFRTSMEVGVRVEGEHPFTGERVHTSSAYFTFVALDRQGRPSPIPPVQPETAEEHRRFRDAQARREARLAEAAALRAAKADRERIRAGNTPGDKAGVKGKGKGKGKGRAKAAKTPRRAHPRPDEAWRGGAGGGAGAAGRGESR